MKHTLAVGAAAGVLIDATFFAAAQASRINHGAQWLAVVLLAVAGLVAASMAAGYGFGAGQQAKAAAVYERQLREEHAAAPLDKAAHDAVFDAYTTEFMREARHARHAAQSMPAP